MAINHANSLKISEENVKPSYLNYHSDLEKLLAKLRNFLDGLKCRPKCYSKFNIYIFGIRDGETISNGKESGLEINEFLSNIDYLCKCFKGSPNYPVRVTLTGSNMQNFAGRMENVYVASVGDDIFDQTFTYKKHHLSLISSVLKSCRDE
jgi:hypothetical protein